MFVKVFETEVGQVAVLKNGLDGEVCPHLSYYFEMDGEVCAIHVKANDVSDRARKLIDDEFDDATPDTIRSVIDYYTQELADLPDDVTEYSMRIARKDLN